MLSLCLFPLFGFSTLFSDPFFHKVHAIELAYPSRDMENFMQPDLDKAISAVTLIEGNTSQRKNKIKKFDRETGLM